MAGVKGRSGGKRPGAGRKKRPPLLEAQLPPAGAPQPCAGQPVTAVGQEPLPTTEDPAVFLAALMNNRAADLRLRAEAAKALMPFMHAKPGEAKTGKKQQADERAKAVGAGRFAASAPPRLAAAGGKRV